MRSCVGQLPTIHWHQRPVRGWAIACSLDTSVRAPSGITHIFPGIKWAHDSTELHVDKMPSDTARRRMLRFIYVGRYLGETHICLQGSRAL
jgi:hypothetical protein